MLFLDEFQSALVADTDKVEAGRQFADVDFEVALQRHGFNRQAHSIVDVDFAFLFKTFKEELVFGGVGLEADSLHSVFIDAGELKEGSQHDVFVYDDFLGVVSSFIAPFHEHETIGRDGGDGGNAACNIGAGTKDEALGFVT